MINNQELWDKWIQTMLFNAKNPNMRGAKFTWDTFPEFVANHVTSTAHIYYEDDFTEEIKQTIWQYIFDKVTLRIKNKDHLPEATHSWVKNIDNHSMPRTIQNWLHETIEGNTAFDVARYAKENEELECSFIFFISQCRDLGIKWLLASRVLYAIGVNVIDFENHVVKYTYELKPKQYTIDFDLNHNLGWYIETLSRERNDDLYDKLSLMINVFFIEHTKVINL